jgi:probable HAF family extracellular repeat protein
MLKSLRSARMQELTRSALLAALTVLFMPLQPAAGAAATHHHYVLVDIGTLPGLSIYNRPVTTNLSTPTEYEQVLTNGGTLVGGADTPIENKNNWFNPFNAVYGIDCYLQHAFVWQNGNLTDLGTLSTGSNSFAYFISDNGLITGGSDLGATDPVSGEPETHAVLWSNGQINDLGTLGGTQSLGVGVNDAGQVVGGAQDATAENRAFLWQNAVMRDLGTLGGVNAFAAYVNNNGQITGVSDTSDIPNPITGSPPQDPFLWQNGKMKDLGNLGGAQAAVNGFNSGGEVIGWMTLAGEQVYHAFLWNRVRLIDLSTFSGALGGNYVFANALNDAGVVVGQSTLPGDQTQHAVIWRNGVTTDLGTLHGDPCSEAGSINSSDQVVGASQSARGGCIPFTTAFLWENGGPMVDLNVLLSSPSTMLLTGAFWINDAGEITGRGLPAGCGDGDQCGHAYLLIPCDANHPNIAGCDYSLVDAATAAPLSQQRVAADPAAASQAELSSANTTTLVRSLMMKRSRWPMHVQRPAAPVPPPPTAPAASAT